MSIVWKAPSNILDLLDQVKTKNHHPRLETARVTVALNDSKPFLKNRFNWGTVTKFSEFNKLWQDEPHDFCLNVCSDVWHDLLDTNQQEALIDLQLS